MVKNRFNRLRRKELKQKDLFSKHQCLFVQGFQSPPPPAPSFPVEPEMLCIDASPLQATAPEVDSNEFSIWGEPFSAGLDCFFEDPFQFA
jgi:hypothetical protein